MRDPVIWNGVAVLGVMCGALAHLLAGMKRALDEHACWAAATVRHYLPQLPDEARRDLTRARSAS